MPFLVTPDQKDLIGFARGAGDIQDIFLVHGEEDQQNTLAQKFAELPNIQNPKNGIHIPCPGDIYELNTDKRFVRSHEVNEISQAFFNAESTCQAGR